MRTVIISLIIASAFTAASPLALAEAVPAEPAKPDTAASSAPSPASAETAKPVASTETTEPAKQNTEKKGAPTCIPGF